MSLKIYSKYFKTVALTWAGCFILFVLAYMVVLAPQQKSQKQVENQLAETKQTYYSTKKAGQEKTQTQQTEQIEQMRYRLNDFVTDFDDSANLTLDISQIASKKELGSFRIKTKEKRGGSAIPNRN